MVISGRVWKFGENMNTDLMMPPEAFRLSLAEQAKLIFRAVRPEWANQVRQGDIIVAEKNFGIGSSRPAAQAMKYLGIEAIVADSINGLFFRNSVNYGLPALSVSDVSKQFQEGDIARIDFLTGIVKNLNSGISIQANAFPEILIKIVESGGITELLLKEGHLKRL